MTVRTLLQTGDGGGLELLVELFVSTHQAHQALPKTATFLCSHRCRSKVKV